MTYCISAGVVDEGRSPQGGALGGQEGGAGGRWSYSLRQLDIARNVSIRPSHVSVLSVC